MGFVFSNTMNPSSTTGSNEKTANWILPLMKINTVEKRNVRASTLAPIFLVLGTKSNIALTNWITPNTITRVSLNPALPKNSSSCGALVTLAAAEARPKRPMRITFSSLSFCMIEGWSLNILTKFSSNRLISVYSYNLFHLNLKFVKNP